MRRSTTCSRKSAGRDWGKSSAEPALCAGLYVHVPFCVRKCPYCDFYSVPLDHELQGQYLQALEHEIALYAGDPQFGSLRFVSLYFGGGTPSLLQPAQVASVIGAVKSHFSLTPDAETSLEANPATLSGSDLVELRAAGVNRVSLGVQSLQSKELRTLGRIHSTKEAAESFCSAREAGFDNLGVDLIFGIPGQTPRTWERTLREVLRWRPEHVSTYALTIEPQTPLAREVARGAIAPVSAETERRMYLFAHELLTAHGYEHYEISNYALPGRRCRHNELYWKRHPYLGLGPSAHSFVGNRRWWNHKDLGVYCQALAQRTLPVAGSELLSPEQQHLETLMLSLRTAEGLDMRRLPADMRGSLARRVAQLRRTSEAPLLQDDGMHIRLTPHGFWLHEEVCRLLS
ncbi:MAG: radical SAM family heme chaperone HemW [candidate division KSB1 bacterium]|nr:radical SAM family heme chaperone HemW [candidate division KSB1 bacterium]MDZ7378012.1 radical SAM family heme chaperone HemW [candidate division KSB1 bacterium]MDZ7392264.1 radical SAM family heme chaperone HemW [candidate division KSB1 bacterium]MDZ7413071.1 radical SAM family heme chaperone HemW [candidate division KSB1 bacterium]